VVKQPPRAIKAAAEGEFVSPIRESDFSLASRRPLPDPPPSQDFFRWFAGSSSQVFLLAWISLVVSTVISLVSRRTLTVSLSHSPVLYPGSPPSSRRLRIPPRPTRWLRPALYVSHSLRVRSMAVCVRPYVIIPCWLRPTPGDRVSLD
jgi:hypothetical protein